MSHEPLALPATPEDEAADWFALKRSGRMSAQEANELAVWLDRAPENRAALEELERLWLLAGAIRTDPELMAVRDEVARARRRRAKRPMLWGAAAAASLVVAAVGGWALLASGMLADMGVLPAAQEQEFHTGVGQSTTVTLPDGSMLTLDTDTAVRTRETGRQRLVSLERGQAFFRVAKDRTRPFIVSAAGKTVTATGTAFDVRLDPGRFEVTLVEGRVTVEAPRGQFWRGQSADMLAGWKLTADNDRRWKVTQVDVGKQTSWMHGWLTFNNDPLSQVAAELNRYSEKKIVIRDESVANKPVIGAFRADDVDGLVRMVRAYRLARVASDTPAQVELAAPTEKKS